MTPKEEAYLAFWKTVKISAEYIERKLTVTDSLPTPDSKLEAATQILEIAFKPNSRN